jgi:hypothetical protein
MKIGDKITYISRDICCFDRFQTYTIINFYDDIITELTYIDKNNQLHYIGCSYSMNKFITEIQYRKIKIDKLRKINEELC